MPATRATLKQESCAAAVPDIIRPNAGKTRPPSPGEPKIQDIIATLPTDPRERLAVVADLYGLLRKHVAAAIEPAINALLQEATATPTLAFAHKRTLALQINSVLALARLSLLDPETNVAARPPLCPSGPGPGNRRGAVRRRHRANS